MSSDKSSFQDPHILHSFRLLISLALLLLLAGGVLGQQPSGPSPYSLCSTYVPEIGGIITAAASSTGIAVAENKGRVRLLGNGTLETVWSAELGGDIVSNLLISGDSLYVVTNTSSEEPSSRLRVINIETGLIRNSLEVILDRSFLLKRAGDAILIVPSSSAPAVLRTTQLTYSGNFTAWTPGDVFLFTDGERALFASADGRLKVASILTGEPISEISGSSGKIEGAVLSTAGRVIQGKNGGEIRAEAINSNGRDWSFKTGGTVVFLKSLNGKILSASNDNFLYLLSEESGKVVWRGRLPGRPLTGALLKDGSIAVAVLGEERLLLFDSTNGKPRNTIELEANEEVQPGGIIETEEGGIAALTSRGLRLYAASGGCTR